MSPAQKARRTTSFKRKKQVTFLNNAVKHGQFTCEYCKLAPLYRNTSGESRMRPDLATIDHIVPLSRGGSNDLSNLIVCCQKCNHEKGDLIHD